MQKQILTQYLCQQNNEGGEKTLHRQYNCETLSGPGGICVLQPFSKSFEPSFFIPLLSPLTSFGSDPLRVSDQEQADIELTLRDLQKQCKNIDGHVMFHFSSWFTKDDEAI